jgi:alpha-tubulin suppressor-like RCC1 family protein
MLRSIYTPRLAVLGVIIGAAAMQACADATTNAVGSPYGTGFSLTVGAATISLAAGGTTSIPITTTRTGGLSSAITLFVTGAPVGLATGITSAGTSDRSTLTITASATLAAGTYLIVVNATAPDALTKQATIAVIVSAPAGTAPAIKLVATGAHTCALTMAGSAYCWGYDADGQLGNNDSSLVNAMPVAVTGGLTFQSLALSKVEGVSCGLTTSGAAYCWGENAQGQLGDGTMIKRRSPTAVAGGLTFTSLAVGSSHACGVATTGAAYCWGFTANGAFGDGFTGVRLMPAVAAPGMTFQSIVAGSDFTCGLTAAGTAFCWGLGPSGQLGNGSGTSSTTPVMVSGGLTFRSIAAGGLTVCGLTSTGKAYCWGNNFFGTLGEGTSATDGGTTRRVAPVEVAGGLTFQSLSAGYDTMCGVTDAGAGYCWGYNFGAVGDGTDDHRSTPVAVAGGLKFQTIAGGTGYSCGVTTTNAVYCWGANDNGTLGDGTTSARTTPVPVRWP